MEILYTLARLRVPFFDYLMNGISVLGSLGAAVPAVFITYWCLDKKKGYFIIGNTVFGAGINAVLKTWFHVPRPFVQDPDFSPVEMARGGAGGYSFPSGHSQNAVSVYGAIATLVKKNSLRVACIVMIILVAFSRLYLGVHFPTDVLGGLSVGTLVLLFCYIVMKKSETHPNLTAVAYGSAGVVLLAAAIVIENSSLVKTLDPENMKNAVSGLSFGCGAMLGVGVFEPIERKFICFKERAVWWAQILKLLLGSVILVGILFGLRMLIRPMFNGNIFGDIIIYFILSGFVIVLWPMTFRWFSRLGNSGR